MGGFLIVNLLLIGLATYFGWVFAKSNIKIWILIAFIYFCWSILNLERVKWVTYMEQELGNLKVKVEFTD
tara:strand:- start:7 stop:216 length:210 start_codon:yes stop_codon:yes gene_type:complete